MFFFQLHFSAPFDCMICLWLYYLSFPQPECDSWKDVLCQVHGYILSFYIKVCLRYFKTFPHRPIIGLTFWPGQQQLKQLSGITVAHTSFSIQEILFHVFSYWSSLRLVDMPLEYKMNFWERHLFIRLISGWFCLRYPDVKAHLYHLPVEVKSFLFIRQGSLLQKKPILFGQK